MAIIATEVGHLSVVFNTQLREARIYRPVPGTRAQYVDLRPEDFQGLIEALTEMGAAE